MAARYAVDYGVDDIQGFTDIPDTERKPTEMVLHIDRSNAAQLKVRFIWAADQPEGPMSVVGSFNDWTPGLDELQDNGGGVRAVTLGLPYGQRMVFRYLGPDGEWFDEPDADEVTGQGSVVHPIAAPSPDTK